ncbi:MAG TPA: hypothetical protein PL163_23180, partial [Leptospiraceae bacterium]|nr:hypothetical protein [Leptospiraceae bacterium]
NTDLEFRSQKDLSFLIPLLSPSFFVLHQGKIDDAEHFLSFELSDMCVGEAKETFSVILDYLESIQKKQPDIFKDCDVVMDAGFQSGEGDAISAELNSELLKRIARLGIRINITIYGTSEDQ